MILRTPHILKQFVYSWMPPKSELWILQPNNLPRQSSSIVSDGLWSGSKNVNFSICMFLRAGKIWKCQLEGEASDGCWPGNSITEEMWWCGNVGLDLVLSEIWQNIKTFSSPLTSEVTLVPPGQSSFVIMSIVNRNHRHTDTGTVRPGLGISWMVRPGIKSTLTHESSSRKPGRAES